MLEIRLVIKLNYGLKFLTSIYLKLNTLSQFQSFLKNKIKLAATKNIQFLLIRIFFLLIFFDIANLNGIFNYYTFFSIHIVRKF